MDGSTLIAIGSIAMAGISAFFAFRAVRESGRLQKQQWRRDELELRRDVLRRLFAYRYRLVETLKGKDGEPFIALNEASIVYEGFPKVTGALNLLRREPTEEGSLSRSIVAIVRAMAEAAEISVQDLDDCSIERPFTPPVIHREE